MLKGGVFLKFPTNVEFSFQVTRMPLVVVGYFWISGYVILILYTFFLSFIPLSFSFRELHWRKVGGGCCSSLLQVHVCMQNTLLPWQKQRKCSYELPAKESSARHCHFLFFEHDFSLPAWSTRCSATEKRTKKCLQSDILQDTAFSVRNQCCIKHGNPDTKQ